MMVADDAELFFVFIDLMNASDERMMFDSLVKLNGFAQAIDPLVRHLLLLIALLASRLEHAQHRIESIADVAAPIQPTVSRRRARGGFLDGAYRHSC